MKPSLNTFQVPAPGIPPAAVAVPQCGCPVDARNGHQLRAADAGAGEEPIWAFHHTL